MSQEIKHKDFTLNCKQCGTLLFVELDTKPQNPKKSLLRVRCSNCGYDAPVQYDSEQGWIEWS